MPKIQTPGFTLIEVMVVVVIAAILAAVAVPAYTEAMRKARRAEGRAALLQLMQQQERIFAQTGSYMLIKSIAEQAVEPKFKRYSGASQADSAYEITAANCDKDGLDTCVLLSATPGTVSVNSRYRDPVCGTLTLSSTGAKATVPATDASLRCW